MPYTITLITLLSTFTLAFADNLTYENAVNSSTGVVDLFFVGADGFCDFSSIQPAITAANSSSNPVEIRVADNMNYNENIIINLNNVLIDGSYANCADARNNINGGNKVKLNGAVASTSPSVRITGLFVVIKGIQIQGNDHGGIFASETSVITLEDLLFFQLGTNALSVSGDGQIDLKIKNSLFLLNTGGFGGAVKCTGSNHSIEMTEDSGFAGNSATASGGAIWLANGCEFSMTGGGFENNSSASDGGAIQTINADVVLKNVTFSSNEANGFGGAIAIQSAWLLADGIEFKNNQAGSGGGAIDLYDLAVIILNRNATNCENNLKCNLFDGNEASFGGAISITESSI
ncbi:MAG: hypothetical protein ACSHWU_11955, partial [Marinicella sp.]